LNYFPNQRINQIVVLAAILVLAGIMRFASLSQRGLIYWDEAKFALEGERFHAYIQSWFGSHVALQVGKTVGTAKPTHALLIALAYFIFGIHDYAPLFLNAFCSVAEVGVLFLLGRRLFGPWAGLIAALLLAVSEYEVIYARSALSESDAALIFLIGVVLWAFDWERTSAAKPESKGLPTRMLFFGALLAGVSFTANYRLSIYIGALLLFDLIWAGQEHGKRTLVRRIGVWIGGLAIAPLAWQLVDVIARIFGHVLFRSEVNILVKSGHSVIFKNVQRGGAEWYLVQALFQLHGGKQSVFRLDPGIYLQWFVLREGWVISALVLVGLWFTLRTRLFPWIAVTALAVVPYLVYIFAPFIVPRNLEAALPFICLLAAAGVVNLAERIPNDLARRAGLVAAGCGIALYGALLSWPLTGERSGFTLAASFVQTHGGRVLASNEVMVFYLPGSPSGTRCAAPGLPTNKTRLAADLAAGYRYAEIETIDSGFAGYIARNALRVGHYPGYGRISIGENPVLSENGDPPGVKHLEYVNVYDLSTLKLPAPGGAKPSTCDRNVPI